MSFQEIIELRLKPALSESHLHVARLCYAADAIRPIFPLDADRYQQLTATEISLLDQMLFRTAGAWSLRPPSPRVECAHGHL